MGDPSGAKVIMVQGTSSHAGKSVLATALCRIFARDGFEVAPFKAQNMSLNSYATPDGGEIGRSQAVQAAAAMATPRVEMNPVLLKPEDNRRSQVVVMGRPRAVKSAREYYDLKSGLWEAVAAALSRLRADYDVVVIEGAGSPAEVNLRQHDIVNMRVAVHADAPVLLVGDIDRGGVFAQIIGTMALLEQHERALVKGYVINKFRGDQSLLAPGLDYLRERTGVPVAGVLPYFFDIHIPEEDSLGLETRPVDVGQASLDVAVMRLPHIANFDDFDPLVREPDVHLRYVSGDGEFGHPDLIIIPGSKTTSADLDWLRAQGLAECIIAARRNGIPVVGICAGYQMLGDQLLDPGGVESIRPVARGLGLLPLSTTFSADKATHQVRAQVIKGRGLLRACQGAALSAYEIHMGVTSTTGLTSPFLVSLRSGRRVEIPEGASDVEGLTIGTYLHGLFHNSAVRSSILGFVAGRKGVKLSSGQGDLDPGAEYDKLAALVRERIDMDLVYRVAGLG